MTRKPKKATKVSHAVAVRWTPYLASKGWTPIVHPLLEHALSLKPPLTIAETLLVINLMAHKWDDAEPFPAVSTLATRLGCGDRNVRKMLERLENVGYVRRTARVGQSNLYDLSGLFAALEAVAGEKDGGKIVELPVQKRQAGGGGS